MYSRFILITAVLVSAINVVYALGVPNVVQTPGALLSGPNEPQAGRTAVIAYHGDMLITFPESPGSPPGDYQVRAWDIADPVNPSVTQTLGFTQHGFMAHGFIKRGELLNSGYTFDVDATGNVSEAGGIDFNMLGWTHGGMSVPWGVTNYWSYNDTSQPAEIYLNQPYGAAPLATFNPVGDTGVIGHPFIFGRYLFFASDQSRSGIASYDISDPTNPVLLDVLAQGSVGGYWPDPVGINGKLYFFFPHDNPAGGFHVVDATDPTDLKLIADVPLDGNLNYAQFQDEYAFSERYKIDLRTFEVVLTLDEEGTTRGGPPIDTSQFSLPIGNLVVTGGIFASGSCVVPGFSSNHCGTGMSIWAHQAAPDTRGPFVGYHAPANGETNYPISHPIQVLIHETLKSETINASTVVVRPLNNGVPGSPIGAEYFFASNDILSIVPEENLTADTTYRVELVANGIQDAVGNGMQAYSFEFSTGSNSSGGNNIPTITGITTAPAPVTPGDPLTVNVSAFDSDGQALEYRYDFGDGSPVTAWSSDTQIEHIYDQPGHYPINVQVRDTLASVSSATHSATVLNVTTNAAGSHDSHIASMQDSEGSKIWVVNPDNDSVSIVDPDTDSTIAEYRTCADPRSVAIDANNFAWISCFDADEILVMSHTGQRIAVLDLDYGASPYGIAMNNDGSRALVSLQGAGEIVLYDTGSQSELSRLFLGPEPRAIALSQTGDRVLVSRFISPRMHGEVWDVAVTGTTLALTRTIRLEHQWGEDLRFDGRGVPNYLSSVVITPDGTRAWVTAKKDNVTRGLYSSGEDLDQDNAVRAMLAQIDLASGEEIIELRRDLDNSEQPRSIAFSPHGDYAFIALQGSNAVLVVDALKIDAGFSGVSSVVSRVGVGRAPQGLLFEDSINGPRLRVHDFLDRSLTTLDLTAFISAGAASFPKITSTLVSNERLSPTVLDGKRVFYDAADPRMSGEGYLSCASCHIDGGHDGQTYDFTGRGEGLRNTTSLLGRAGMAHGMVHWSANFDEVQDFEHDIREQFGGEGFLSDSDFASANTPLGSSKAGLSPELDALAAYLSTFDLHSVRRSPFRDAEGNLSAAGARGSALFTSLGCANCHAGTAGIANTALTVDLRNIGTVGARSGQRLGGALSGIDVPTLHGIWRGAPYLHSGEAAELAGVFVHTGAQVYQAESAVHSGGYEVRDSDHWSVQDLAVVREGEFVHFNPNASATFTHTASANQTANLSFRYHANYQGANITITINGAALTVVLPVTLNNDWPYRNWGEHTVPITLSAGSNSIVIRYNSGASFALDEISIGGEAQQLAAANPHSVAATLPTNDFADLLAYLHELDGRPHQLPRVVVDTPLPMAQIGGPFTITGTSLAISSGNPGNGADDEIYVAINQGDFELANGLSNWSYDVPVDGLSEGWHTVTIKAVNGPTGTSTEQQLQFYFQSAGFSSPAIQIPFVPWVYLLLFFSFLIFYSRHAFFVKLKHRVRHDGG